MPNISEQLLTDFVVELRQTIECASESQAKIVVEKIPYGKKPALSNKFSIKESYLENGTHGQIRKHQTRYETKLHWAIIYSDDMQHDSHQTPDW